MQAMAEQLRQQRQAQIQRLAGEQRSLREIAQEVQNSLEGNEELLRETANAVTKSLQRFMDVASGIIHGSAKTMSQDEIDAALDL